MSQTHPPTTTAGVPQRNTVLAAITVALPQLGGADQRVARTIIDNPETALHCSVSELADTAGVAPSTVIHACKALGFRGFQDLKLALAQDIGRNGRDLAFPTLPDNPTRRQILDGVLQMSAHAIIAATSTVTPDAFDEAVTLLARARHVVLLANGNSRAPADDTAYRLASIGLHVTAPADVFAQHRAARVTDPSDTCLAVSYTGSTRETIEGAELAMEQGASVVAVTSHQKSPLTELATVSLVAGSPERSFRLEAMTSRLAQLAVIDALYTAIAMALGERATTALDATADITTRHIY